MNIILIMKFYLNCRNLKTYWKVKYIRILINQFLKWDKYIKFLIIRIRKLLHKFVILRSYLPVKNSSYNIGQAYLSLVESIIKEGIISWGRILKVMLHL